MLRIILNASFAGCRADGRGFVWNRGDAILKPTQEAEGMIAAGCARLAEDQAGEVVNAPPVVESYELPPISPGARKLIIKHKLTDEQVLTIKPTGKGGKLVDTDLKLYVSKLEK